jgi:hypothetical protein
MSRRRKEKLQLQFDFMIFPANCRRACDVPHAECSTCGLDTLDHTVGFLFEDKNYHIINSVGHTYCQVCIKDYEKVCPGTLKRLKREG